MSDEVRRVIHDLWAAGFDLESISRTVSLPTFDVARVVIR